MRTIVPAVAWVLIMGLIVTLGGPAAARDENDEPMTPAVVTGTVMLGPQLAEGSMVTVGPLTRQTGVGYEFTWEASDPRLSGESTYTGNWDRYPTFQVQAGAFEIINEQGRWTGPSTSFVQTASGTDRDTVILNGEGGYEGLTAYLLVDWSGLPATFIGGVFPGHMPSGPPTP